MEKQWTKCRKHRRQELVYSSEYGRQWICPICIRKDNAEDGSDKDQNPFRADEMAMQDKRAAGDY